MSYPELQKLYGEPVKEIRGANSDVAKIIVGEEPPYQSIRVSGELLTVERGPSYKEETTLAKVSEKDTRKAKQLVEDVIKTIEKDNGSAPVREVTEKVVEQGYERAVVLNKIEELREQGDVYEPETGELRTV